MEEVDEKEIFWVLLRTLNPSKGIAVGDLF